MEKKNSALNIYRREEKSSHSSEEDEMLAESNSAPVFKNKLDSPAVGTGQGKTQPKKS